MSLSKPVRGLGRPATYKLPDKTRVPGVTTITGSRKAGAQPLFIWYYNNGYDDGELGNPKNPRAKLEAAAGAGTLAHLMVENHIHGQDPLAGINTEETDPAMLAAAKTGFGGYCDWQKVMDVEYLVTEEPMVSEQYRYGGTPDAIGRLKDDRICLLDWKSSNAIYGDYIIQLAAYRHLWDSQNSSKMAIRAVYLLRFGKEHGEFSFHSWPDSVMEMGWEAFLCLRRLYDLDKKLGEAAK